MSKYEEGMAIIEEKFGGNKDNIINLATIKLETNADGKPRPAVRSIDAYYEDGVFYAVTYAKSNKMQQVDQNTEVSISVATPFGDEAGQVWFTASGVGENLGWVLKEENAELRTKLRSVFANWYDMANDENDENCCYLAIRLTSGVINKNHFETLYYMDFENKTVKLGGRSEA